MVVITVEDIIVIALLAIALLVFVGGIAVGCLMRFGEWLFSRDSKDEKGDTDGIQNER